MKDVCKSTLVGARRRRATKPSQPIGKSAAGASLSAQVIVSKVADYSPVVAGEKCWGGSVWRFQTRPCLAGCGNRRSFSILTLFA